MKVRIKKEGKDKTFRTIKTWSDVTLETWGQLVELQKGSKAKEALETIAVLSNIPKHLIKELGIQDVALILKHISALQDNARTKFRRIIKINGIEYGFHPKLEDITLGEWADIETYLQGGLDKNLPDIMSILYRPIVQKKNKLYTIEAYDGEIAIRAEEMKTMNAEEVQSALVFFYTLGKKLLEILPLYLMEQMEIMKKKVKLQQTKTSLIDGVGLV
jgi:hypothetical protein